MEPTKPSKVQVPNTKGLLDAARIICEGGTVAVPTETVYGLAARADDDAAVAGIYAAKGRPDFNPLIVHVPDVTAARHLAEFDDRANVLAHAFWPGPLTMVLPRHKNAKLAAAVSAGLPTVALRCPAHPVMQALLIKCGLPLAAPSANKSGTVSPTCADHVADSLGGRINLILDGGDTAQGIESTIVALRNNGTWAILRHGPITEAHIAQLLGGASASTDPSKIEAPGQMTSHYAPGKPVRLGAIDAADDEFLIGFGKVVGNISLSPAGDLAEAAARLYACLHLAAAAAHGRIAVAAIPQHGIGAAINDRLHRAAA